MRSRPITDEDKTMNTAHITYGPHLPWAVGNHPGDTSGSDWREIVSLGGEFSPAYVGQALKDNAAFIVRACNAHQDLVAALESLLASMDGIHPPSGPFWSGAVNQGKARLVLAKAKGE